MRLNPLFHHVLSHFLVLLSRIDRGQGSVENVVAGCEIEVVDERIRKQVSMEPVVVSNDGNVDG